MQRVIWRWMVLNGLWGGCHATGQQPYFCTYFALKSPYPLEIMRRNGATGHLRMDGFELVLGGYPTTGQRPFVCMETLEIFWCGFLTIKHIFKSVQHINRKSRFVLIFVNVWIMDIHSMPSPRPLKELNLHKKIDKFGPDLKRNIAKLSSRSN